MVQPTIDVVGVGNAIVDVISTVPLDFIETHKLAKGSMTLIDAERASKLYAAMPPGIESSGGSAANTVVGVASFGGTAAYIGKVRNDSLGKVFGTDMREAGVPFDVPPGREGPPTARCLIQVTPDAERTMNTFLGISTLLAPADIDEELVASAALTYCEGYLWDVEVAKAAIRRAMDIANEAGRLVSLTLSDPFCVERHRAEWLDLITDRVDVLFANEHEILALFETDDFEEAAAEVRKLVKTAALTRSAAGSVIVQGDTRFAVPAAEVDEVVDPTGAGDMYASGFVYGLVKGASLERCAELASLAAAEVISHVGARPHRTLVSLT